MSQEVLKNRLEELFTSPGGPPPTGPLTLDGKPAPAGPKPALSEAEGAVVSARQTHEGVYRALNRVSQTLNRLAAPSEILELIYTAAGEVLDNRNFSIALLDEANRSLSFPICTIDGARREVGSHPMGNGLAEYVIRTRAPLFLARDVQPELQKRGIDEIEPPAHSLLSMPLMAGDKLVGVVTLQDYENVDVYTTEHLELLTILASQAAGALEHARLFERMSAALAETQRVGQDLVKFKLGIERSTEAMFMTDIEGRIVYANPAFEKVYGFGVEEALEKTPRIIKSGLIPQERYKEFWDALLSKQVVAGEIVNKTKDGRFILVDGSNNPILDDAGNLLGFLAIHRDITERKRAEEALSRRAVQLQTAAEVSRAASSILNPDELLPRVVDLIRDAFDLYYVGIFLVDLDGQHAALRAGSGEAGRLMLERGHRLAIGDSSMIGWCIAHCEPRVAQDVGGETVRFDNPLLPETRSELALPLVARGDVLGAMTVQSRLASAFSEQDISVLQTMTDQVAHAIANAQLFEQESRRSTELSVLNEMGRTLASVLEVDAVYELIYEYTARLMDASNFFIALYHEEEGQISFPIAYNDNQRISVPSRSLRSGLTDYILRHRQPLLLSEDVPAHMERLGIEFLALGNATPALSWLGVPVNYGDRILGAIVVQSVTAPALYRENDRDVLTAIASQTAVALENARLFEQARRQLDHLATIQQTLSALTATYTREEMIDALLPRVAGAVRADTVSMFLIEGEHLIRVGRYPLDDEGNAAPRVGQAIALADYPLTQRVIETRRPLAFLADDPRLQEHARQAFRAAGITASATIPLVGREGVLGTLAVNLSQPGRAFSQDDLGLLQTLADQATVALEKVRLLEETRHLAQHRQLINQVTGKMRSAMTVDEVLRIAVDELRQATQATRAVARLSPPAPAHDNGQTGRTDVQALGDAPGQETAP
ncbi:MAG TPA: GAF domain-containing protein [Anaerolineae bacterium]|nr:GAF domain-containing protein [Anaerolineae bacterium]